MPNDAKLGLIFGIGLVILIGVVFFRRDAAPGAPAAAVPSATTFAAHPEMQSGLPPTPTVPPVPHREH